MDCFPSSKFILCGDFNNFDTNCFRVHFSFVNRVISPTRGQSHLDQIWISECLMASFPNAAIIGPPLSTSDHNCVLLKSVRASENNMTSRKTVFDYRRSHVDNFMHQMANTDFNAVFSAQSVNDKCSAFYKLFFGAFSCIPRREIVMSKSDKPWITPVLKKLIDDRWIAYRSKNWPVYNHLKEKVKVEILKAKQSWSDRILKKGKNIWSVVRDLQGGASGGNSQLASGENMTSFISELTSKFKLCFNQESDVELNDLFDDDWDILIEPYDVYCILKSLKLKQSSGYDGISARILKECAVFICEPLSDIYKASIATRSFPELWKNAFISPVPKAQPNEYRQISLLPIISKVFERIVLSKMRRQMVCLFGNNQHAFRPSGSTTSALIDIHNSVTSYMEARDNVCVRVTCLDFTKAFDKIQHHRLVNNLLQTNLKKGFLMWLLSFLTNRCQRVSVCGHIGPLLDVTSGVPQGSVLGPYLFSLFISALQIESEGVHLVKFADDLTLIESCTRSYPNPDNLDFVRQWSEANKMLLNRKKCQQMLLYRSSERATIPYEGIEYVSQVKVLGVTLNDRLTWNDHFERVILTASRRLYTIRALKSLVPKNRLVEVFNGFILSVLLYAAPVFCKLPASVTRQMERLRKRAHRIICDESCQCGIVPDFVKLHKLACLKFLTACELPDHPLHDFVPPRLPASRQYRLPICVTSRRLRSFFPCVCAMYNNISLKSDVLF